MNYNEQIAELSALTQTFLLQEFSHKDWIFADGDSYAFFKKLAGSSSKTLTASPSPTSQPHSKLQVPTQPMTVNKKIVNEYPKEKTPLQPSPPSPMSVVKAEDKACIAEEKKSTERKEFFRLAPPPPSLAVDLRDIRTIVTEIFPNQIIVEPIAPPTPEIVVLYFNEVGDELMFLQNLTKAVCDLIAPGILRDMAKIEAQGGWNELLLNKSTRLIICSRQYMKNFPDCAKLFREDPDRPSDAGYLGTVEVILLAPIADYQKDISLKRAIWKTIQEKGRKKTGD